LGASSSNVDLSVVSNNDDGSATVSSDPSSGGTLLAQELPKEFSPPLATDKLLNVSKVKDCFCHLKH
jgi:phosphoglucan,water dikinase